jgi:hypothetical protein
MLRMIRRTIRVSVMLATAVTLSLAAGASAQVATLAEEGAAPSPAADGSTASTDADPQEAMLAFAQCMRDHGVDMEDPPFGEGGRVLMRGLADGGVDALGEAFQAAQQACGSFLEAMRADLDPAEEAERLEEMLAMAQCMRDHGIEGFPDPVIAPGGGLQRFRGGDGPSGVDELPFDPFSEEFAAAREACVAELGIETRLGGPAPNGGER